MMFSVVLFLILAATVAVGAFVVYLIIKKTMVSSKKQDSGTTPPEYHSSEKHSLTERFSIPIKAVIIGFLTILLLIPLEMMKSLIRERQHTQTTVISDITSKWGSEQTVSGPFLLVPYITHETEDKKTTEVTKNLLLLPESLIIDGTSSVEKRKRGIYETSVYKTDMQLTGTFDLTMLQTMNIDNGKMQWNHARVLLSLSDLRGIDEQVTLQMGDKRFPFESGIPIEVLSGSSSVSHGNRYDYEKDTYQNESLFAVGLNAKLDSFNLQNQSGNTIPFSIALKVNGSQGLFFVPIGKKSVVDLKSDWATPSFDGDFLPKTHSVTDKGFSSHWEVLDLNRSYGQVIKAENAHDFAQMAKSRFGVNFIQEVDQYQQNMRSVKYAILIVLLTFVVVFFIELLKNKSVNPIQYLLVGLALVLFYSLLLSLSEVLGFNVAYLLAALMTTGLITFHMASILKNRQQWLLIGALLSFLYLFVFILIQMKSYALLVGSLGLFAILAIIMFYSNKIRF